MIRFITILLLSTAAHAQLAVMPQGAAATRIVTPPGNGAVDIIEEGDSLTAGYLAIPYSFYLQSIWPGVSMSNVATSGDTIDGITSEFDAQIAPHDPTVTGYYKADELVCIGTNDIANGMDAPTLYTKLKIYWGKVRGKHIKCVVMTIPIRTDWAAPYDTVRKAENVLILSDPSQFDAVINMDNLVFQKQADGIHPTAYGSQQWANYIPTVIDPWTL